MEFCFDAMLSSISANENSNTGHIKCLHGPLVPHPCHMAISHYCQACNQGKERPRTPSQIRLQILNQ